MEIPTERHTRLFEEILQREVGRFSPCIRVPLWDDIFIV